MKAKAWLLLSVSGSETRPHLKITGVRQYRPVDALSIEVEIEIPEEILWPKARLLVEHEEDVQLTLTERLDDAATV